MRESPEEWRTFDAVYLINLEERVDRRRELEGELQSVGFREDDPRLVWIRATKPLDAGEFPSIGARGCFMSHLTCLRSACASGHKRILILEDDACFPKRRIADFKGVLKTLANVEWDVWYGGGKVLKDLDEQGDDVRIVPIESVVGVQTTHCVAFQGDSIALLRSFLELILTRRNGHPEAGPMHVDGAYTTWRALNPSAVTLIATPQVCVQRSSRSDITTLQWFDKAPVIRSSIAVLRRMRNRFKA